MAGDIRADNPDSQMNHDILLPGHIYLMIFKERLQEYLLQLRTQLEIDTRRKNNFQFTGSTSFFLSFSLLSLLNPSSNLHFHFLLLLFLSFVSSLSLCSYIISIHSSSSSSSSIILNFPLNSELLPEESCQMPRYWTSSQLFLVYW